MPDKCTVEFTVNDHPVLAEVEPGMMLLRYLRDHLQLTSVKNGCSSGHCGSCTIILNGKAVRACLVKMGSSRMSGARIETVEGLAPEGSLHPLQVAFVEQGAVQCGFCTPGMLMTAKALLDACPCPSEEQIKAALAAGHNLCRCTGYARIIRAIQSAAQRLAEGQQPVGREAVVSGDRGSAPWLRPEAIQFITGAARFADDVTLPNMLYGKILWSAHPHALILGIDTTGAERLPGVVRVITARDIPGENRCGLIVPDQPAIASDRVHSIADPVAAVLAESETIAAAALALIRVEYEPLPAVFSPEQASRPDAPQIHDGGNLLHHSRILRGDVEDAFGRCAVIVEHDYTTPRVEHGFLEPEAGIGVPTDDGGVIIRMGTQTVFDDRKQLAQILALPEERVRVVQTPMGGAFGGREDLIIQQFLGLGARLTQRPVKITLTRAESLRVHQKRHPARMHYKTGADAEGHLLAVQTRITLDTGAYASLGVDILENAVEFGAGPYHVPNLDLEGWSWFTNNVMSGAMRGFGVNQVAFAMECNLDEIARQLNMDPFEIRLINALDDGLLTSADHVLEPGQAGIKPTIIAAREALKQLPLAPAAPGKRIGIGVASAVKNIGYGHHIPENAGAIVELDAQGHVKILASQHEYGQGAFAGLALLASGELGVPLERIKVTGPDSAITPPTGPTTASRQTFLTGNAVLLACRDLKEIICHQAADMLGAEPAQVHINGACLEDAASGRSLPIGSIRQRLAVERLYTAPDTAALLNTERSRFGRPDFSSRRSFYCYAYGTHVAVVEVDEKTGKVRVLTVIAAHDLGHVINRGAAEGQVEGGVMMGLGYALSEEYVVEQGVNLTDSLLKCHIPMADQAPRVIPLLVEVPHPWGPLGAKGFAEAPSLATAPAILNAIHDAVGVRVRDLPATPIKIIARA